MSGAMLLSMSDDVTVQNYNEIIRYHEIFERFGVVVVVRVDVIFCTVCTHS